MLCSSALQINLVDDDLFDSTKLSPRRNKGHSFSHYATLFRASRYHAHVLFSHQSENIIDGLFARETKNMSATTGSDNTSLTTTKDLSSTTEGIALCIVFALEALCIS